MGQIQGFSSAMKLIVFFFCVPLVSSGFHSFITTYTGIHDQAAAGIPEFSAVSSLDRKQIDYYDSNTMKLIPKQHWMEEFASKEEWKEYTEIREKQQQIYKLNIDDLMERFNQTDGVHTYQRMYGCDYDDETGRSHEFDEYGYDGEDFISLDLKESRYTAHVPQAKPTVQKWNNDRTQLKFLQQYLRYDCVYWLKELLHFSKAAFKKTDHPKVSLLQKNPDYYMCHVTGFLFRNTTILWRKNGRDINSSSELEFGETLPNEDGTFQRTLTLHAVPDVWKKSQYTCVVEHQSLTEPIQKILTVNEIKSNKPGADALYIMHLIFPVIILVVLQIVLYVLLKHRKASKACKKTTYMYVKKRSHQKHAEALYPLISTPSCDFPSTPEA